MTQCPVLDGRPAHPSQDSDLGRHILAVIVAGSRRSEIPGQVERITLIAKDTIEIVLAPGYERRSALVRPSGGGHHVLAHALSRLVNRVHRLSPSLIAASNDLWWTHRNSRSVVMTAISIGPPHICCRLENFNALIVL